MLPSTVLDNVPTDPGVYLFKDRSGRVVYVGKAKNLRVRVRQYFRPGGDERFFVAAGYLGRAVVDIETIVVTAEKEALLLENHLIKQHQPKFNVKLRDDKQYIVLRLQKPVPSNESARPQAKSFPRVQVVRNIRDDDAMYFGPYHSATSARQTLRILNRHFQLRTCTDHVLETRGKTCLQYQIKRCPGPCAEPVSQAAYREQVDDVALFLGGKDRELTDRLRARMHARAEELDFEAAAAVRDSIAAIERTLARQDMVQDEFVDQDVWGLYREADVVEVIVLFIRAGKLVGKRAFSQREQELSDGEVLAEHAQQYYATEMFVPDEVMFGTEIDGHELLADWLSGLRGRKVRVTTPQRGKRARMVDLADKNAAASFASKRGRDDDTEAMLHKVAERLSLSRPPKRIECFDIAHLQGNQTVASMVTFVDGVAQKSLYRKFTVKTQQNDDFASMYEVLKRRFTRSTKEPSAGWATPDLVVVDGGKGQLASAVAAITDCGVEFGERGVDVVSLAKERDLQSGDAPDRVYLRNAKESIALRQNSPELYLLARLRDEAHRFANTFHRHKRSKATLRSELDDLVGVGPARKKLLLTHFGSVRALKAASLEDIARVRGISSQTASSIHLQLQGLPPREPSQQQASREASANRSTAEDIGDNSDVQTGETEQS